MSDKYIKNDIEECEWDHLSYPPDRFSNGNKHIYVWRPMFSHSDCKIIFGQRMMGYSVEKSSNKTEKLDNDMNGDESFCISVKGSDFNLVKQLIQEGQLSTLIDMGQKHCEWDLRIADAVKRLKKLKRF